MKYLESGFQNALNVAPDIGIRPAYFLTVIAKSLDDGTDEEFGFWTGDEDIITPVIEADGDVNSRTYYGGSSLEIGDIPYVNDLTDNPLSVSLNPFHEQVNLMLRGYEIRLASSMIYATAFNKGALASNPDCVWVGIIDEPVLSKGSVGEESTFVLSIRSEIMAMLTSINPAKSSDAHQQRRQSGDEFSKYSGSIQARKVQWFKRG